MLCFLCLVFETGSHCSSGWPRTHSVAQAALELKPVFLPQPPKVLGFISMHHHTCLVLCFLFTVVHYRSNLACLPLSQSSLQPFPPLSCCSSSRPQKRFRVRYVSWNPPRTQEGQPGKRSFYSSFTTCVLQRGEPDSIFSRCADPCRTIHQL